MTTFREEIKRLIRCRCPRTARHRCLIAAQELYGTESDDWKEAYGRMLEGFGLKNVDKKH